VAWLKPILLNLEGFDDSLEIPSIQCGIYLAANDALPSPIGQFRSLISWFT
jgi:hypothetical protein